MSEDKLVNPLAKAQERYSRIKEKQTEVYEREIELKHHKLQEAIEREKAFSEFDIDAGIAEEYKRLAKANEEFVKLARSGGAKVFLDLESFKDKIVLFPKNIVYLSAETGKGKSTTVANLTYSYLKGSPKKILIITNEENTEDVINRIAFINEGWSYKGQDEITEEQLPVCTKYFDALAGRVTITHDYSNGVGGMTTTLEGIKAICSSLLKKHKDGEKPYDIIMVDYIQKIDGSTKRSESGWNNLKDVLYYLDNFKNVYPAPIVIFGQQEDDSSGEKSYKEKIKGWKGIGEVAGIVVEIKTDFENLRTEWIIRKNRFKGGVGTSVFTGFERGKFIEYTPEFANKTEINKEKKQHKDLLSSVFNKG